MAWARNQSFIRGLNLKTHNEVFHLITYKISHNQNGVSSVWGGTYKVDEIAHRAAVVLSAPCGHGRLGNCLYSVSIPPAQNIRMLGIIDLMSTSSFSLDTWVGSKTFDLQDMKEPVLLIKAHYNERYDKSWRQRKAQENKENRYTDKNSTSTVKRRPRNNKRKRYGTRERPYQRSTLLIISLKTRSEILKFETSSQDRDGYGGHTTSQFKLHHQDGQMWLSAMRQDDLSAHYARCKAPKPYQIRFKFQNEKFVAFEHPLPKRYCGD